MPLQEGRAGIYVCGLTVQSEPHVGHVRSAVNFDVLRRWLRHQGYDVTFIRNVTDIDDKILAKAAEQGRPWYELAYEMHRELDRAYAALNVTPPTYEPAATGHVPEMLELIARAGRARPRLPAAGRLRRRLLRRAVLAGVRRADPPGRSTTWWPASDADPRGKRDPRDFALWKGCKKAGEPETAAGPARGAAVAPAGTSSARRWPGSTSAPPSTSTAAASTCASPTTRTSRPSRAPPGRPFASYWLHNAWITTAGEKMSKSLGNSLTIPAVLERFRGIELRYYLVSAHYRRHVEFSFEALEEAAVGFRRIEAFLERARSCSARRRRRAALRGLRRRDGRRPRHPGRGRRRLRHRARGQPALDAGDGRRCRRGRPRCAPCSTCSGSTPPTPRGARRRRRRRRPDRRRRRPGRRPARAARGRPRRPRTSPAPTRSATGSPPPASRSRTPPTGPTWALDDRSLVWPETPSARARSARPPARPHGRLRRAGQPRPGGQGPDAQGRGPALPQGLQASSSVDDARSGGRGSRGRGAAGSGPATPSGSPGATRSSRRCARACRSPAIYVAEGAERDGRLREAFALAADAGISLLEVGRGELDRMTSGAVHQGLAAKIPAYEYAHPDDLLDRADELARAAADRGPRLGHRPPQPGGRRSAARPASAPTAWSCPSVARPA